MSDLDGRAALVTGGASGIGLAVVRRLAARGARVAILDVAPPPDGTPVALAIRGDVGNPGAWAAAVDQVTARLGGLDFVHLNAGVTTDTADVADVDEPAYRRVLGVNVDGVMLGLQAVLPALTARGGGTILVTASLAGLTAMPADPVYAATKHFVVGLVRSAADQLTSRGIRLLAICPGIVDTPLVRGAYRRALTDASFPLIDADDVAAVAERLLTGEGEAGSCWVVQPGRPSAPYRFGRVPGPRSEGSEGMAPPLP